MVDRLGKNNILNILNERQNPKLHGYNKCGVFKVEIVS